MSAGTDASVKLSARFPGASALTGLVDQLKTGVGGVQAPEMPGDKIQSLTAGLNLQLPDTSNWNTAIPTDAKGLVKDFPDADSLTKPITEPVGAVHELLSIDLAGTANSLAQSLNPQAPSETNAGAFLEAFAQPVDMMTRLLQDPELTQLFSAIGKVTGSSTISDLPKQAGSAAGQLKTLLQDKVEGVVVGFLSLISAVTSLELLDERVTAATTPFSLAQTRSRFQAVLDQYGSGPQGLAQQLGALDAGNEAAVASVQAQLNACAAAYQSYLSALGGDLALTEVGLALLGVADLKARFDQIDAGVAKVNWSDAGAVADWLTGEVNKATAKLKIDAGFTIVEFKQAIHSGIGMVTAQIDSLDPSKLTGAVQTLFQTILSPFKKLEDFKTQVETIVRGALQTISDAIQKIDIKPLKDAVEQALGALKSALGDVANVFDDVRAAIQSVLSTVKTALDGVKTFVLDPQNGLKKKIEDVFHTIQGVLDELNIKAVVDEVTATLQPISNALAKVEFQPVINAVVQAIGAITDVLKTVTPLLVTDALKEKLSQAASFLNQIDFNQIGAALTGAFDEILASVDQDALGAFKDEYQQVVDSIKNFDPEPTLKGVQSDVFDPLLAEFQKVHPGDLLKPVNDAFQQATTALEQFKPGDTFAFLTAFFQDLLTQFDSISPAKLLQPVEQLLDDLRAKIASVLHLDQLLAGLDQLRAWLQQAVNAIDFGPILDDMSAGYGQMKDAATTLDPAIFQKYAAKLVSAVFSGAGAIASATGLTTVVEAIQSGAGDLTQKLDQIKQKFDTAGTQVAQLDAASDLATLRGKFGEAQTALAGRTGAALPDTFTVTLGTLDPMATLAPMLPRIQRVQTAFAAQVSAFDALTAPFAATLQTLGAPLNFLRTLLSPLGLLRDVLLSPLRSLFPTQNFASAKDLLLTFLNQFDPGEFRGELAPLFDKLQAKLKALVDDTVLNPLVGVFGSVKDAIDLLDIHSLVDAINQPFLAVEGAVKALDPTPLIAEIDGDYQEVVAMLQKLNPAAFIQEVSDLYENDIVGVIKQISPEELLLPSLRALFQQISGALGAFDIEALFKPVLDRLKQLDGDLGDGLHVVETAYSEMLTVLASAGGASASVSVSAQVG